MKINENYKNSGTLALASELSLFSSDNTKGNQRKLRQNLKDPGQTQVGPVTEAVPWLRGIVVEETRP